MTQSISKTIPPQIPGGVIANMQHTADDGLLPPTQALSLPDEVTVKILGFLSSQDLATCSLVCKDLKRLCSDGLLWKKLFRSEFTERADLKVDNFQEAYKKRCIHNLNFAKEVYASHTFKGHAFVISSLVFANDKLFSGSWDKTIKMWDLNGACLKTFTGHTHGIRSLVFANDKLFSGSYNGEIKMWEVNGACLQTFTGHTGSINSLVFANDMLFSGSSDAKIKMWDLNGTCLQTLIGHKEWITSLAFANDTLFSSSYDGEIKMWNLDGACLHTFKGHRNGISSLVFANDKLFSGSYDGEIKMWEANGACLQTFTGHTNRINSLVFANGKLFSGSEDDKIKMWDLNGTCLATLAGHTQDFSCLAFARDKLFSGSVYGMINTWDFGATNNVVFKELADLFKSNDHHKVLEAMERFKRMPQNARDQIYGKLYEIIKDSLADDYRGCAEHAFHDLRGQTSTPEQKAQAIELYLGG